MCGRALAPFLPVPRGVTVITGPICAALSQPARVQSYLWSHTTRLFMGGKKLLMRVMCFIQLKWGRFLSPVNRRIPGCHILLQRAFFPGFALVEMWKSCMTQHSVVLHLNPFVVPAFISTWLARGPNNNNKKNGERLLVYVTVNHADTSSGYSGHAISFLPSNTNFIFFLRKMGRKAPARPRNMLYIWK